MVRGLAEGFSGALIAKLGARFSCQLKKLEYNKGMATIEIKQMVFEGEGRAEIFSFRPENIEKEKRGNLFFLGKIAKNLSRNDSHYYLLHSLAAILKKEYYSPSHLQPSKAFEEALKKVNALLSEVEATTKGILEMVALAVWTGQVTFSSVGNPEVLLVRERRIFRLHKIGGREEEKPLFRHVTKGGMKSQDRLIISTSELTPLLETPSFTPRLIKRPWERVKDYISLQRLEVKDTRSLAILQVSINTSGESTFFEKEKTLSQELEQSKKPLIPPSSQLRLPIISPARSFPLQLLKKFSLRSSHGKAKGFRNSFSTLRSLLLLRKNTLIIGLGIIVLSLSIILSVNEWGTSKKETREVSAPPLSNAVSLFEFKSIPPTGHASFFQSSVFFVSQNQLYEVNPDTKVVEPLLSIEHELKGMTSSEDTLFLITKRQEILEIILFNPSERSVKKEALSWPLKTDFIKEVKEYAGNLYFLESLEKQIVKYTIKDFSRPQVWISKETKENIQHTLSFAPEGSIYLLESPHRLVELRLGKIVREIALPLQENVDNIFTTQEQKNLYLLNSEKGQVIVIEKESGTILKTIEDPRFKEAITIEVDESTKHIRLLNPQGIFLLTQLLP